MTGAEAQDWRSLLFVAADDQRRLASIVSHGADAVILDLEDGVPDARKPAALGGLSSVIKGLAAAGQPIVVRINSSWSDVLAHLTAAITPGVTAIMVPKVEGPERLDTITEVIADVSFRNGRIEPPGVIALIEGPTGLSRLEMIARCPQLIGLALGSEDFALSMRVPPSPVLLDLPCRQLALAAATHGLMALGLPISIATVADEAAWTAALIHGSAIGITGALCIHPSQVKLANEAFSPTREDQERAQRVVAAWEAAAGGAVLVDGRMIDRPVALAARRTLARDRRP